MAEYYPLLAKAVGSLPNSTPDSRRVVYERARKALIGQLRTLHPPVPDDDIDRESLELDRAIERLESELATGGVVSARPDVAKPPEAARQPSGPLAPPKPLTPVPNGGGLGPTEQKPLAPLRTKFPLPKPPSGEAEELAAVPSASSGPPPFVTRPAQAAPKAEPETADREPDATSLVVDDGKRSKPPRLDPQRPFAPQPPGAAGPKRRLWIIPVAVGIVVALVAFAAWKLRDRPETIARGKPVEQTQADSGKIAERVGGSGPSASGEASKPASSTGPVTQGAPSTDQAASAPDHAGQPSESAASVANAPSTGAVSPSNNPELPVAHRAALLVEAPNEPNKVKTFLGTVVWKLNNVSQGPNDAVGLAVEADIDLPDDKMKVVVTFAKNTEASLPASHTINVRYSIEPGSYAGDVKQISVPQMRPEASASGEPLAGVTVQIVPNSFLVGLSPGNAETANTDLIRRLQWIDIPMLLDSGKIAKLTFEKSDSGQRDLSEALDTWQKQP
jgi:hypothetical protein